jgi:hypothetical protein
MDKQKNGAIKMTHEPKCEKQKRFAFEGCPVNVCEDIEIKVPISVCAHSEGCDAQFNCMGHTIEENHCAETQGCNKFNVTQKLNLVIPLKFKADCDVGEGFVDFNLHDNNHKD